MNKLTAEKCRDRLRELQLAKTFGGISLKEQSYFEALEIALPILEQQERGEGWIEWGGGQCPVDEEAVVDVMQRNGVLMQDEPAGYFGWKHGNAVLHESPRDIIAYRIIPEQATNQNGEQ